MVIAPDVEWLIVTRPPTAWKIVSAVPDGVASGLYQKDIIPLSASAAPVYEAPRVR